MSAQFYSNWWIKNKALLENTEAFYNNHKKLPQIRDRNVARVLVGNLFAKYCLLVKDIDQCLDQMCNVQKTTTVRKLMDATVSRLHELKNDLVKIDISEYHYIDGNLVELKLIPHSIEILNPSLSYPRHPEIEDLWKRIKNGEEIYTPTPEDLRKAAEVAEPKKKKIDKKKSVDVAAALLESTKGKKKEEASVVQEEQELQDAQQKELDEQQRLEQEQLQQQQAKMAEKEEKKRKRFRPKGFVVEALDLTPEELEAQKKKEKVTNAVEMIQLQERARQARIYYNDLLRVETAKKAAGVPGTAPQKPIDPDVANAAARKIGAAYRRYRIRKELKKREVERRKLIGMYTPSWKSNKEYTKLANTVEKRRQMADQRIREYIKANLDEKARILKVVAPGLFEDIGDEIRDWFHDWYYNTGVFQDIPPEELGGTILVVRGETVSIEDYLGAKEKEAKNKNKSSGDDKKEKAKLEAEKKKEEELKKKMAAEAKAKEKGKKKSKDFVYKFDATPADKKFGDAFKEYKVLWHDYNDADNPLDKPDMSMITEKICYEMQLDVRKQVDELMRLELEMLKEAQRRDKWFAKKKKGKYKPKKQKKPKKKKKPKGKKDPTGFRKIEDLFQELVNMGIIRTYTEHHIADYRGDFSYQNCEKRELQFDPPPTLGDVRQAVIHNCILPLGTEEMIRPKSVLIVGPRLSGKHLLANAIFNDTKCVLFDLSPNVLADKFEDKKKVKLLIHMIGKMARLLQPSILFVDGAEKMFYKKVPKEEKWMEPKKGAKLIKKLVKPIQPEDRVMVLGITNQPWAGGAKLQKTYQKIILIPRTDYGSAYLYWNELLMPYHGVDRNINISALAQLTRNYPLVELKDATERVLAPRRLIQLYYRPLQQSELLASLVEGKGPVTDKEYGKFEKWYRKTAMGRDKAVLLAAAEKMREKEAKMKNKKK